MISIRAYDSDDLDACVEILHYAFLHFNRSDILPEKWENFIAFFDLQKNREQLSAFFLCPEKVLVAVSEGQIIGVLRASEGRIQSLFVHHQWHRQGIAQSLVKSYEEIVKQQGEKVITVLASSYAERFYEKIGFHRQGERFLKNETIWVQPMKKIL